MKTNKKRNSKIVKTILKNKLSYNEIAIKFNLSRRTIRDIANANGISKNDMIKEAKLIEAKKIIKYFKGGIPVKEIINQPDVTVKTTKTIYRIFDKNGIKYTKTFSSVNGVNGVTSEKKTIFKKIVSLYERKKNPLSFSLIAKELNNSGYKTITNKQFSRETVRLKYLQYKNI